MQTRRQHEELIVYAKKTLLEENYYDEMLQYIKQHKKLLSKCIETTQVPLMIQKIYQHGLKDPDDWYFNLIRVMLCLALSFKKPSSNNYVVAKQEMERLAFMGDSTINLCIVLN